MRRCPRCAWSRHSEVVKSLRILEVNGLVTIRTGPGGRPVVASSDAGAFGQMWTLHLQSIGATYRKLLQARCELESMLARRAAERLMRQHLQRYQDYCERRCPARVDVVDRS